MELPRRTDINAKVFSIAVLKNLKVKSTWMILLKDLCLDKPSNQVSVMGCIIVNRDPRNTGS